MSNNYNLSDKKALYWNLKHYCEANDVDLGKLIPKTFHVKTSNDSEYNHLHTYIKSEGKKIWIVKPGELSNRGNGIQVCRSLKEIDTILMQEEIQKNGKPRTYIIQEYIQKPLLFKKRKFDFRCFMMLTSVNGKQKGYWYKEGYIRTSSETFTLKNLHNKFIHLTNDAV